MKKQFFLSGLFLLLLFSSCNLEKRLYSNGWYSGKSRNSNVEKPIIHYQSKSEQKSVSTTNQISQQNYQEQSGNAEIKVLPAISAGETTPKINPIKEAINSIRKKYSRNLNDPNRVTYAQARKSMADKGCTPDGLVMATYYMAWASVILCWFGIGILVCLAALIMSIFATNRAAASGTCADENLAIVKAAQRICYLELIWFAIIAVFTALLVLAILGIIGYYGGF